MLRRNLNDCYFSRMAFVYILFSRSKGATYTGYSENNPNQRLREHLSGNTYTTKNTSDWEIVWYAEFRNKGKAIDFEKYLKSHSGRAFMKKRLVGDLKKSTNSR